MSHPEASATPPPASTSIESRRGGLIAWGVILIVIGIVVLLGALMVLFDWFNLAEATLTAPGRINRHHPALPKVSVNDVASMAFVLAVSAGIVWTGIASCLARRWVRPVVVFLFGFVAVAGVFIFAQTLLMLPGTLKALDTASLHGANTPSALAVFALFCIRAALTIVFVSIVPYLGLRFFASEQTARLLDATDPRKRWIDRLPLIVFAWVAFSALYTVSILLRLSDPALPAFVTLLTGSPAIIGLSILGVLMGWGTWLSSRLEPVGWIITFVIAAMVRISAASWLWSGGEMTKLFTDPAVAASIARAMKTGAVPDWLEPVMATSEAVLVILFGLYAARKFPKLQAMAANSVR